MVPRPFVRSEMIANAVMALQTPVRGRSPFASASASASGKSGLSVPAAGRIVEAADGGEPPCAVPPPGGPLEIFSEGIRAGGAAAQADDRHGRQVLSACAAQ